MYIATNEAGWRNDKHRQQWRSTLDTYAYPAFGDLPVSAINTALVLRAVEPIWTTKPETAGRCGVASSRCSIGRAREYRTGENPARWREHLENVLPKRSKVAAVEHLDAVPYADLPAFMDELRGNAAISARALESTILNASRTGEVIGAREAEIDLKAGLWTIPANRMKGNLIGRSGGMAS